MNARTKPKRPDRASNVAHDDRRARLEGEFEQIIAAMQAPKSKRGVRALFAASPAELGKAAVKAARAR